jgi:acyl-CoA reductase-like NAD-dependent aldehyde dehydrogenase
MTEAREPTSIPDTEPLNLAVAELRAGLPGWLAAPLAEKIALLRRVRHRVGEEAPGMVAAGCAAQGVRPDGPWAGELCFALLPLVNQLRALEEVLGRVAAGREPIPAHAVQVRPNGQVTVDVFPATRTNQLLYGAWNYRGRVWMQPGVGAEQARSEAARAYRGAGFDDPGVALVLGAGNFASLPAMDALSMLCAEGCVVALKLNPVNGYLRPFFERIFADFVDRDWLRLVDGGADVGGSLAHHPGIDRIHMTGSAATYDAMVWGVGDEAARNRAAGTPLLDKPFTAELGGVNPLIVVPGAWNPGDLRRQADTLAFSKALNCGHVCGATQILVLPAGWVHADALLEEYRTLMRSLEPRQPYYPGTDAKVRRALAGHSGIEALLPPDRRILVTDLDPSSEDSLFTDEVFADVLGVVRLPAPSAESFLANATRFANDHLTGTLAATILIDPATAKAHAVALDSAVANLRYGTVGVNAWAALGAGAGYTPWGGFPGHTPQDVGSGIGWANNPYQLNNPQKTVFTGWFRPPVKPFASASHRTLSSLLVRVIDFATADDPKALPGLFAAALRG